MIDAGDRTFDWRARKSGLDRVRVFEFRAGAAASSHHPEDQLKATYRSLSADFCLLTYRPIVVTNLVRNQWRKLTGMCDGFLMVN